MHALRELAVFRAQNSCAVSLYLGLDPSLVPTAAELDARLGALLSEASRFRKADGEELSHDASRLLHDDIGRIGRYFDEEFERNGARGLAVFSCGADNLWRVLSLPETVPDTLRIGRRLYVAPLVPLADGHGDVLVVVAGQEQGQIWSYSPGGELEQLADRFDEQPRRHDQGGWSQARYARHIDKLVHEHLRDLAAELDRRVRRLSPLALVVVAGEEVRPEFERLMSSEVRKIFIGWAQTGSRAGPAGLRKAVQPLVERLQGERQQKLAERWQEELGRDGHACAGWERTLEAASDGRVDTLLFRIGLEGNAFVCSECERISAHPGNCPLDGTTLIEQKDGVDLLVHRALEQGGAVSALRGSAEEQPQEIGALLRY